LRAIRSIPSPLETFFQERIESCFTLGTLSVVINILQKRESFAGIKTMLPYWHRSNTLFVNLPLLLGMAKNIRE
jgi:hypothetical protein